MTTARKYIIPTLYGVVERTTPTVRATAEPDRFARLNAIGTQLARVHDRLAKLTTPKTLITDTPARPPYPVATDQAIALPKFLTPGVGGTWMAAVRRLATLSDSQVNAALNVSPWTEQERRAMASDVILERRERQRGR